MNLKTTLILLVFLGLAVAALVVTQTGRDNNTNPPPPAGAPVVGETILGEDTFGQSLSRIVLRFNKQDERVELIKQRGRWSVVYPHRFPADTQAVNELLGILSSLKAAIEPNRERPAETGKSIVLGSDRGDTTITMHKRLGVGRGELTVTQGNTTAHYNADATLHELFEKIDIRAFFARSIDAPLITELGRIEINVQGETPSTLFERDGRWWIQTPTTPQRALGIGLPDAQGVNDFIAWLDNADILEHRIYDAPRGLAQFGLDQPLIAVRYLPIDANAGDPGAGWLLRVGADDVPGTTRFVSFGRADDPRPAVFTMPSPKAIAFGQRARSFRDPRIVSTPPTLIDTLTVRQPRTPDRTIAINPRGGATVTAGNAPPVEWSAETCAAVLNALTRARAVAYAENRLDELGVLATVELVPRLDGETESFTIGEFPFENRDDRTVWVRRGNESVALRVDRTAVNALLAPADAMDP